MNNLKLVNYGTFLSGRSLAKEIVSSLNPESEKLVSIDFEGITGINQSFLSQLFLELLEIGFHSKDISVVNVTESFIKERVYQQIKIVFAD